MDNKLTQDEWIELLKDVFKKKHLSFLPSQMATAGIFYDFCYGARIYFSPCPEEKTYLLKLVDLDSGLIVFNGTVKSGDYFVSQKHYFIRYGFQISEYPSGKKVFQHKMDLKDRPVHIDIPVTTLGDTLAWYRAVELFEQKHKCSILARVAPYIKDLLRESHTEHEILDPDAFIRNAYASYTLAVFHNDENKDNSPDDYRQLPLHQYAGGILGVAVDEAPCSIAVTDDEEIPNEPYVCIATQASGGCKMWNHPIGWDVVVDFLKENGYRVLDIDRDAVTGSGIIWNKIPRNAEDWTGDKPLTARAELLRNAEFFIGLGSGLSWLARCCNVPTVLISGFSEPWGEFYTQYRVINKTVCHGCFNDTRYKFENADFQWCPKYQNTSRHWECQRSITPQMVIDAIKKIPIFKNHKQK